MASTLPARLWSAVKHWLYKWVGGLFLEPKKDGHLTVSLGRVSFVTVLIWMMTFWNQWRPEAPLSPEQLATVMQSLGGLMTLDTLQTALQDARLPPSGAELPPGLLEVFYALTGYVFGSKAVDVAKARLSR